MASVGWGCTEPVVWSTLDTRTYGQCQAGLEIPVGLPGHDTSLVNRMKQKTLLSHRDSLVLGLRDEYDDILTTRPAEELKHQTNELVSFNFTLDFLKTTLRTHEICQTSRRQLAFLNYTLSVCQSWSTN